MFSFDYWVDAEENSDGAVLQYSVDGGLNWQIVGPLAGLPVAQRDQGINWYEPGSVVVSNPGQQPLFGPYGWTGQSNQWLTGKFNLDGIVPPAARNQVRLRIAFSSHGVPSGGLKYDGFAFDNVFVGDKTKNVLVEHFTNANINASVNGDNYFNNLYAAQISFRNGRSDFYDLQYHVRFPQPDFFSQSNSDDAAARALHYKVQQPPYSVLDGIQSGKFQSGDYTVIDQVEIDRRALRKPLVTIYQMDELPTGKSNTINARVHVRADSSITFPLYVQITLVESPVIVLSPNPNPGSYQNIVRKFLFTGDGITQNFTQSTPMAPNDSLILTKGEVVIDVPIADSTKLYLAAFVQNFETGEILQSKVVKASAKIGAPITGIEPTIGQLEQIQLYPNPANGKFNFKLPGDFPSDCIWKIADQRGINVMEGNFSDAFNGEKTVDIASLTNGVYFVAIGAPGKLPVYKKLVVLNVN